MVSRKREKKKEEEGSEGAKERASRMEHCIVDIFVDIFITLLSIIHFSLSLFDIFVTLLSKTTQTSLFLTYVVQGISSSTQSDKWFLSLYPIDGDGHSILTDETNQVYDLMDENGNPWHSHVGGTVIHDGNTILFVCSIVSCLSIKCTRTICHNNYGNMQCLW